MDALIVVDVQRDFCPGGALAVPDADAVIEPIKSLAGGFELTVATRDWHPPGHCSFRENGGTWPVHCVRDTAGAQLHPRLAGERFTLVLDKGQEPDLPGYSAFERTDLEGWLRSQGVQTVHVAGLALDYCVKATAIDARRAGFEVRVHRDATRAVEVSPGDAERALEQLRAAGVAIVP